MILITRPKSDSELLAKKLDNLSIKYLIEPIINIEYLSDINSRINNYLDKTNIILITSKNALKAIEDFVPKDYIFNIVGLKTAEYARMLEFKNINIIAKDVNSLVTKLTNYYDKNTKFIYACSEITTIDLAEFLKIYKVICYKSVSAKNFSPKLIKSFDENSINVILFFSEKTAEYFLELSNNSDIIIKLENIIAITISEKVTAKISKYKWKNILTASYPSEDAIIKLIQKEIYGK